MGILTGEQAALINVSEPREKRRIYIRPEKVKKIRKIKRVLGLSSKTVQCFLCYKRINTEDSILIEGGGVQGHRSFYMCNSHV